MNIKKVKTIFMFLPTLLLFIGMVSYIYYKRNKNYIVIRPVIITKNVVFSGEKVSTGQLGIDYRDVSVKKEDINKYITVDNLKNYINNAYYFRKTIIVSDRASQYLMVEDIRKNK